MGGCVTIGFVEMRCDNADGTHMTQARDQYQAHVNMVMKIQII
jgi:hypothetical protein